MARYEIISFFDLQLFADGGAAAGAGAEGGTGTADPGVTAADAGQRKGAKNPLADVVYGKQAESQDASAANQAPDVPDERRQQYEAFRTDVERRRLP